MATYKRPLWLEKDGKRQLFAADAVADARADGWDNPTAPRANGEPWNPPQDEDLRTQADALTAVNENREKVEAKKADRKAKEDAERQKQLEKQAEAKAETPDFKVAVVEPEKKGKSKK